MKTWWISLAAILLLVGCQHAAVELVQTDTAGSERDLGVEPQFRNAASNAEVASITNVSASVLETDAKAADENLTDAWAVRRNSQAMAARAACPPDERAGVSALDPQEPQSCGKAVLETGHKIVSNGKPVVMNCCWDFANALYNRAGYLPEKRQVVFKGQKKGPYANPKMIQPGDWLYYVNHEYRRIEHSAIFVDWIDYKGKKGMMLSYVGGKRKEPARYVASNLKNVYYIIRPKAD